MPFFHFVVVSGDFGDMAGTREQKNILECVEGIERVIRDKEPKIS